MVKLLLEHGATVKTGSVSDETPIEAGDVENMTPLHYTVRFSAIATAELLLESHMCVDIAVRRRTWVHHYEKSGSVRCERLPLHTSAGKGLGLTPLHYAAWTGNVKMVAFFLRHGADPNAKSEFGETPLHLAIAKTIKGPRYLEYRDYWTEDDWRVEVLAYNARADGNYEQLEALDDLILLVRMRVLGILLDNGRTNVNTADDDGESVLHKLPYCHIPPPPLPSRTSPAPDQWCSLHLSPATSSSFVAGDYRVHARSSVR